MIWAGIGVLWVGAGLGLAWIVGQAYRLGLTEQQRQRDDQEQADYVLIEGLWALDAKEDRPPGEERPSE